MAFKLNGFLKYYLVLVEPRLDGDGGARGAEVSAGARHEGDVHEGGREDVALVPTEAVQHQLLKPGSGSGDG